jgi:hypothetical protein
MRMTVTGGAYCLLLCSCSLNMRVYAWCSVGRLSAWKESGRKWEQACFVRPCGIAAYLLWSGGGPFPAITFMPFMEAAAFLLCLYDRHGWWEGTGMLLSSPSVSALGAFGQTVLPMQPGPCLLPAMNLVWSRQCRPSLYLLLSSPAIPTAILLFC